MKRFYLAGLIAITASSLLAGCSTAQSSSTASKPLNVTIPGEAMTADPNKALDTNSSMLQRQIYEGLYTMDDKGNIIPGVAEKISKPSNEGKTYTLMLRKNAKWSNGETVTAKDFETSLRRELDPKTKAQNTESLSPIKNYSRVYSGKLPTSQLGVKALSKTKLQIDLGQRTPWFNYLLTKIYPINTKAAEKYGQQYGTNATKTISNGAYQLSDWNGSKDSWSYIRNKYYWDNKATKISKINVKVVKDDNTASNLFKSDQVQETQVSGQFVKANKQSESLHITPQNRLNYLMFNAKDKTLNNPDLHRAISYALNRKSITNTVLQDGSIPAYSEIIKGQYQDPRTGKDYYGSHHYATQNIVLAKKYWAKFLKETGKTSFTTDLMIDDTDADKRVGEYIQGQIQKYLPNSKITITSLPHAQHVARDFAGKIEMNLTGYTSEFNDPVDMMNLATKGNSINFTQWSDPTYEKLMAQASDLDNHTDKQRAAYLEKADQYLMKIQGTIPLYQPATAHLLSTKIGGIHYTMLSDPLYRYAYYKN